MLAGPCWGPARLVGPLEAPWMLFGPSAGPKRVLPPAAGPWEQRKLKFITIEKLQKEVEQLKIGTGLT